MELVLYLLIGIVIGVIIGWLVGKLKSKTLFEEQIKLSNEKLFSLDKELLVLQSKSQLQIDAALETVKSKQAEYIALKDDLGFTKNELDSLLQIYATTKANCTASEQNLLDTKNELAAAKEHLENLRNEQSHLQKELSSSQAINQALDEKLQKQKTEMEELRQRFMVEFENIANKILEHKSNTFTALNQSNMKAIIEPLGENIKEFRQQVQAAYGKESNERFSLQNEIKNLIGLNLQMSKDAQNLTRALKSESKTQGRWGEIILENILEKSGLRKNEEYFMEHQLFDASGKPMLSALSGKKMRPDALIVYPDERHVIVDAKVSLLSFSNYADAEDEAVQEVELLAHVRSIKNHINDLHSKAYDDYDKAMDFVMMFVPNEAAYFAALKGDANIWEYAYERRILLISPTNLIAALKLLADLWKRERNERNSLEIANRAIKMYDKLVSFVDNLDAVGKHLETARDKYEDAVKQLHTGKDNFFSQANKMKALLNVVKAKDFSQAKLDLGVDNDLEN